MKLPLKSRKSRAVFKLWIGELVLVCFAVTMAAWLRFYSDPESHLAFAHPVTGAAWDLAPVQHFYDTDYDLYAEFDEDYWYGDDDNTS